MPLGELLILLCGGFAAGLVGALFGLGGGILVVPLLVLLLKLPMHHAIATSLLCVIATSSAAASKNVRNGLANVRLGMTLELWTVVGAMLGGTLAGFLSGPILMRIFGIALAVMSIPMSRGVPDAEPPDSGGTAELPVPRTPFQQSLDGGYYDQAEDAAVTYHVERLPLAMSVSAVAGALSGLLGVGGGIIKVPVLTTFCRVPIKAAAATSNFMIGVTAVASAFVYYGRGEISPFISAASVVGVFGGSRTGSHLAARIHGHHLRRGFALLMILIGAQLIWKSFGGSIV